MNLKELMDQAKKMQNQMKKVQDELKFFTVKGKSGGNTVIIKMDGTHNVIDVKLSDDFFDPDLTDKSTACMYILTAVNKAVQKIKREAQMKMKDFTLNIK